MKKIKPFVLLSLDGWGVAPPSRGNAITEAAPKNFYELVAHYPVLTLQASGEAVGLMWGEMGNSEVGHLTMGSGRIIYQTLPRIHKSIADGTFFQLPLLAAIKEHVRKNNSSLHLIGMVSDGGVHSHIEHLFALLDFCEENNIRNIFVHAILDGRDTKRDGAKGYIAALQKKLHEVGFGKIASLSGRYFAMDRDNRWQRTADAFYAIALGKTKRTFDDPVEAVHDSYRHGIYDEEFIPTCITENGKPVGPIREKDAVIFFNFRADRARQLVSSFVLPDFSKFPRRSLSGLFFVTFTEYDRDLPVNGVLFPPEKNEAPLAKILQDYGLKQFHIAETEKYAHVTYFFNGGHEAAFVGEKRVLISSPSVSSYDQKPEMSAYEIVHRVVQELSASTYHFYIVNFANADMVGHTGNLGATVRAIAAVDDCIGQIYHQVLSLDGYLLITADHGNAEQMIHPRTGDIDKEHSTNPVPCIIAASDLEGKSSQFGRKVIGTDLSIIPASGTLADISPTILKIMNLPIPESMTGRPLI